VENATRQIANEGMLRSRSGHNEKPTKGRGKREFIEQYQESNLGGIL
jgi:hypothetical protein